MLRRSIQVAWLALALVAIAAASIQATTIFPRGIETNLIVWNGKVMFVQPGSGLTILDAETGRVLLRETAERGALNLVLMPTLRGVLLFGGDAAHDYAATVWMVDVTRSLSAARPLGWKAPGRSPQPVGDRIFITEREAVVARRAGDGSVVWRHLVTGDLNWSKVTSAGVWVVEGQVALVRAVTLLDPSTGRILGLRDSLMDREFVFQSLEANRFVAWAKPRPSDRCQGRILRTVTFSPERGALTATEDCRQPLPSETVGTVRVVTWTCDGFPIDFHSDDPQWRSCALSNPTEGEGLSKPDRSTPNLRVERGMLEHAQRGWQLRPVPWPNRIWLQSGYLFLDHRGWDVGVVERIDIASGRPVWRYVFPSWPAIASTNSFFPSTSAPVAPDYAKWKRIMSSPVQGSVRVQPHEDGKPTPNIFDPAPALASSRQ